MVLYYPDVFCYYLRHTWYRQTAEDATQEAFVKAIWHLYPYAHRGEFKAFVHTIATNVCIDISRRRNIEQLAKNLRGRDDGLKRIDAAVVFNESDLLNASISPAELITHS
mgnify:FL=1